MFLSHVVVEETDNSDESTTWVQKVVQPTGPPVAVAQSKLTIFEVNVHLLYTYYRIAGNFRGIQFSRFSRLTGKPRKLNPRNKSLNAHSRYSERPSTKITSRNLCILSVRENWFTRKFPAIRYVHVHKL